MIAEPQCELQCEYCPTPPICHIELIAPGWDGQKSVQYSLASCGSCVRPAFAAIFAEYEKSGGGHIRITSHPTHPHSALRQQAA